jgi:Flp pilus assembly protein TadD
LQGIARVQRRGRQPFDYRPGLPLHLFLAVYVKPPALEDHKFVGQVEQMHASRCYQASKGRMGCIDCHDPHVHPTAEKRVAYYRDRCLACHETKGCSVPLAERTRTSKDDNCLHCHMPAGESDIQHHSITDHRVPRRPEAAPAVADRTDDLPMVHFHRELLPADDREAARDLGIALVDRVERYAPSIRHELGRLALKRLDPALKNDPTDVPALDAKAHALWAIGDAAGAAAAFDHALAISPRREVTLQWAAELARIRKRDSSVVTYLDRAIQVNPWRHEYYSLLGDAQARLENWPAAFKKSEDALNLNPANLGARQLLVESLVRIKRFDQARTEMERFMALHPPNAEGFRRWFEKWVP